MTNKILITNPSIYTEAGVIEKGFLKVENGIISAIGHLDELKDTSDFLVYDLPSTTKIIPGMIDVHIHGVNGADTMDASTTALETMARALPSEGTTSFLATTMTQDKESIEKALQNAGSYINKPQATGQSEIIGIHLEGPFINKEKAGAQPEEHIINPNVELFKHWQSIAQNQVKLVTLAPEQSGAIELIEYLNKNKVIASIGHSNATFKQVEDAIEYGLTHVTHLYNQMSGLHHREPGVVGASLLKDELIVEIIADGIHSRPEAVQLAFQQKSSDKLVLITDAMRAKCLKSGTYDLGGQQVTVQDGKAVLDNGTLAGSILTMNNAFSNMLRFSNCSIEDAIMMSSTNAAKELGIYDRKGSISVGKDGDIVVLDENNEVELTFCRGHLAYQKGVDNR